MSTERLFVNSSFKPQLRGVNLVPPVPKIVSWSDGTDAEIAALLDAHYAGTVNLHEYWNIGDTRTVHLSAMPATGVNESHVEQDVEFQLVNAGGKELANGRECAFIVQLEKVLCYIRQSNGQNLKTGETGYMNDVESNIGGWKDCARRTWCNSIFRSALSEETRGLFKLHKNKTTQGNQLLTLDETEDYFALPCAYNIFGDDSGDKSGGSDEDAIHWAYYIDTTGFTNKKDKGGQGINSGITWWLRSPNIKNSTEFLSVYWGNLTPGAIRANYTYYGLAPFGTI